VPMRIDRAGPKEKADAGRLVAMRHFAGLPEKMTDGERREYWASIEVPYQAFLRVRGDPGRVRRPTPGAELAARVVLNGSRAT